MWDTGVGLKESDGASERIPCSFKCVGAIVIVAKLAVEVPENIRPTCRKYGVKELLLVDLAEIEFVGSLADPGKAEFPLVVHRAMQSIEYLGPLHALPEGVHSIEDLTNRLFVICRHEICGHLEVAESLGK